MKYPDFSLTISGDIPQQSQTQQASYYVIFSRFLLPIPVSFQSHLSVTDKCNHLFLSSVFIHLHSLSNNYTSGLKTHITTFVTRSGWHALFCQTIKTSPTSWPSLTFQVIGK